MKLALICPSNILFMPYVENYTKKLTEQGIVFTIINWDRLDIENTEENKHRIIYKGGDNNLRRGIVDYLRYKKFLEYVISKGKYDKLIIFGLQLAFFLNKFLLNEYKGRYVIDVRDYNKIIGMYSLKRVINNSEFTVISSPGFINWLPKFSRYIVNHNTNIRKMNGFRESVGDLDLNVSYIGALRDFDVNIKFINALKKNGEIKLLYHGEGMINEKLEKYIIENKLHFVEVKGKYLKNEEGSIYLQANLINGLLSGKHINDKTLLPNRLYNSVIHAKPIVVLKGTYLADVVEKFKLGIVLNSLNNAEFMIKEYLETFNQSMYEVGREAFFKEVWNENEVFFEKLLDFIQPSK